MTKNHKLPSPKNTLHTNTVKQAEEDPASQTQQIPPTLNMTSPAQIVQMQRIIGNHAVQHMLQKPTGIQRKFAGELQGRDANRRLQSVLSKPPKGRYGRSREPDMTLYNKLEQSDTVYTWEMIQEEFGHEFTVNLAGYVANGTQAVNLYRADSRSPEKLKGSNPPGFGVRQSVPFSLLKADLLKNPGAFAEDHVRSNRQDLKSYATDVGAGGYASGDRHLYQMNFGAWTVFEKPQQIGSLKTPRILANAGTLQGATKIAVDTNKPTGEIFVLFEVGLDDITHVRRPGEHALSAIDWDSIVEEKK